MSHFSIFTFLSCFLSAGQNYPKKGVEVGCDAEQQTEQWIRLRSMTSIRSAQVQTQHSEEEAVVERAHMVRDVGVQVNRALCVSYSPACPKKSCSHPDLKSVRDDEYVELQDDAIMVNGAVKTSQSVGGNDTFQTLSDDITDNCGEAPSKTQGIERIPLDDVVLENDGVCRDLCKESEPGVDGKDSVMKKVASDQEKTPERKLSSHSDQEHYGPQESDYSTVADALSLAEGEHVVVTKKASFSSQRKGAPCRQLILGNDDYCEVVFTDELNPEGKVRRTRSIPRSRSLYKEDVVRLKERYFSMRCRTGRPGARHPEDTLPTPPPSSTNVHGVVDDKEGTPFTEVEGQNHGSRPPVRASSLPSVRVNAIRCDSPENSISVPGESNDSGIHSSGLPRQQKAGTDSPISEENPLDVPQPVRPRATTEYTFVSIKKKKRNRKPGDAEELDGPPTRFEVDPPPPTTQRPATPIQRPATPILRPATPTKSPFAPQSQGHGREYEMVDLPSKKPSPLPPMHRHVYEDTEPLMLNRGPASKTVIASPTRKNALPV